jgi:GNAT superfamily N-acetyltransferase
MKIKQGQSKFFRLEEYNDDGDVIASAYLYLIHNDGHDFPYGLIERVFVSNQSRGQGLGTKLVKKLIELAEDKDCYKIVGTSRYSNTKVHEFYEKLGFVDHGKSFRMNLNDDETSI